jgi:hypothetical protein
MEDRVFPQSIPYTKADGSSAKAELQFVDIPAGTLLFRGVRLPDISKGDDPRYFYRDFLGDVVGSTFCLVPTHNVFFYPFPYIPFGAHTVGERFNAIQIYVTRRQLRLVCMTSPAPQFRGTPKQFDGTAPIQRCDKFSYSCKALSKEEEAKEAEVKSWDNCLSPTYAKEAKVNGWMAIADYDSLDILGERQISTKNTAMSKYLLSLNSRNPGKLAQILTWMYTDKRRHRGIPEIVLYPWADHPGDETIITEAADEDAAIDKIIELSGKFSYLPIACVTAHGILDGITTDFKSTNIGENSSVPASEDVRAGIEKNLDSYLNDLQTKGLDVPDMGIVKMRFDSRTGFYVLDKFVGKAAVNSVPYSQLLLPMETERERQFVNTYAITFRTFFPSEYMKKETISSLHPPVHRAFIFERPAVFKKMFDNLGKPLPPTFVEPMRLGSSLFQRNSAAKRGQAGGKRNKGGVDLRRLERLQLDG